MPNRTVDVCNCRVWTNNSYISRTVIVLTVAVETLTLTLSQDRRKSQRPLTFCMESCTRTISSRRKQLLSSPRPKRNTRTKSSVVRIALSISAFVDNVGSKKLIVHIFILY